MEKFYVAVPISPNGNPNFNGCSGKKNSEADAHDWARQQLTSSNVTAVVICAATTILEKPTQPISVRQLLSPPTKRLDNDF